MVGGINIPGWSPVDVEHVQKRRPVNTIDRDNVVDSVLHDVNGRGPLNTLPHGDETSSRDSINLF